MPSTHQSSDRRERLHCDGIRDRLSEDPARWLDWDLMSHADRRGLVMDLIDGIDDLERVRAWRAVERRLAARDDREPRARIIQRLDRREQWLELHGERPERLEYGPRRPCDCCEGEPEWTPEDLRERDRQAAQRLIDSHQSGGVDTEETSPTTEPASLGQFATDGGRDQ